MITQAVVKFQARLFALMLALFLLPLGAGHAGSASEIDATVDTALRQFNKEAKGADDYLAADTLHSKFSVVAFGFGKEGLMGGWSAKGTKFTKLKK